MQLVAAVELQLDPAGQKEHDVDAEDEYIPWKQLNYDFRTSGHALPAEQLTHESLLLDWICPEVEHSV